jgi:RimJ/RimL family protein N-acetyltransferase
MSASPHGPDDDSAATPIGTIGPPSSAGGATPTGVVPNPYPADLERNVQLADGARVHLRPIRQEDDARLVALHARLSRQTAYQRFFSALRRLPLDWAHFLANVDYIRRLALVAARDDGPDAELIAVARYEPTTDPTIAEVAFVVQDDWQNRGLGSALFQELLAAAAARGITQFQASVLADNPRMLDLIARFGDIRERTLQQGVVELLFNRRDPPSDRPPARMRAAGRSRP